MTPRLPTEVAFRRFESMLQTYGLRASLAHLLDYTDYRYIGIFRFDGAKVKAVVFYDRENPGMMASSEMPESATYCCFVRDGKGAFTTANSLLDKRLEAHPARDIYQCYTGVPIMDAEGALIATLCHYDVVPRDPDQLNLPLVFQIASKLAQGSFVPPYHAAMTVGSI